MCPAVLRLGPDIIGNAHVEREKVPVTDESENTTDESGDEQQLAQPQREVDRLAEDRQFVPVIVKRTDETRRHPDDVLVYAIEEGLEQLQRPALSLGLSSIAAGLILGFTAMAVAIATVAAEPLAEWPMVVRLAVALVYPLGFVVCLSSGAELFTEHTATAVYPVLDRRSSVASLLRLWAIVIAGNLIGAFFSAVLLTLAEPIIGARDGYVEIGRHLVTPDAAPLLVSAVLAGWLMALGAWLIVATPPTVSQIVSIYIVTFLIGLGGLHHSIAGSVEMFAAAMASDEFTVAQSARFISLALVGNVIGGSLFVAALNYAHIRETRRPQ
jgi:formate/nitrite transporter FocA (FNT family)